MYFESIFCFFKSERESIMELNTCAPEGQRAILRDEIHEPGMTQELRNKC